MTYLHITASRVTAALLFLAFAFPALPLRAAPLSDGDRQCLACHGQ